jgi:hypothetical protein
MTGLLLLLLAWPGLLLPLLLLPLLVWAAARACDGGRQPLILPILAHHHAATLHDPYGSHNK